MTEKIAFNYDSPESLVSLLIETMFDNDTTHNKDFISDWRDIITNNKNKESLFLNWMKELFPNGGTLDIPDLKLIYQKAIDYVVNYSKINNDYIPHSKRTSFWVYNKFTGKRHYVSMGDHSELVLQQIIEFFGEDWDNKYSQEEITNWCLETLEISSCFSSLENIVYDIVTSYIYKCR